MRNIKKIILAVAFLTMGSVGPVLADNTGGSRVEQVQMRATVESVDYESREVVFLNDAGERSAMVMGPEVRNLGQIKAGDQLTVTYTEGLAVQIMPPGTVQLNDIAGAAARAEEGDKPGLVKIAAATVTVAIDEVNLEASTVTFTDPQGIKDTINVERPEGKEFIKELKPGDLVDIIFSRSVAIAITASE
jgi:hypothetical protein